MQRISIYFLDGKSLAFSVTEEEIEDLICWINAEISDKPFKITSNKLQYFIFRNAIQYIII